MHRRRRISGRLLLLALVLGLATPAGCGAPYLLHLAQGQASVLLTSRSIDGVIADPATGPAKRAKLTLVQRVKRFGEEVIGLKADASFTTFTPVDGPAALYVVTAAPKLALEPRTWTFPFVGTIPYKGFFDKALAEAEEARLAAAAFDTHLRPAAAYSTLGWFTDPVLEPLLRSRDVALANVILHEKTHTTIFVPNHVAFNEGLASFVGRQGAIEFFAATDGRGSPRHREAARRLEDERRFGCFLRGVTSELARLYASDLPRAEKLELREILFQGSRRKLLSAQDQYHYPNFVAFYTRARINNAFLVSLQTYTAEVETFVEAYERHGRDLAKTVAFFKTVGRLSDDPAAYVRRWLAAGRVKAAAPPDSTL